MDSQAGFIFKVLLISVAVSLLIKYGGPRLAFLSTTVNPLVWVLLPTVILAIALLWRAWRSRQRYKTPGA
ncbi:MAG: hypothetical protein KME06_21455 [Kastovskya adunca ATA6-11-RM4]|jgi:hypothetical protein|nr:hypothetical protein [Kastovskya adunca ATA6-11-RM4]